VEDASSAANQVTFSRRHLEGGSKGWSCASVAQPRWVDSKETATARSHGVTFPGDIGISSRQEAFEGDQVGEKASARAVAAVVVVERRSYTTPRLTKLG
jgi:hypothetical protein